MTEKIRLRTGETPSPTEPMPDPAAEDRKRAPRGRPRRFTETMSPEDLETENVAGGACAAMPIAAPEAMLRFFSDVGKILEQAFDLDELLDGILQLTMQVIPAERSFVVLSDPDTGQWEVRAGRFRSGAQPPGRGGENLSTTILQRVLAEGKAVLTTDAGMDVRFRSSESVIAQLIRGAMCVPLKGRSEILGAIYVDSRVGHREFSPDALKLLLAVGVQMGIAVENLRLYEANVRAVRLAAVGQAVAGLSHCVRNILNGSEGGFYLLQKGIRKGEDNLVHRGMEILSRSRTRLKELVLDMLASSKPKPPVFESVDANSILGDVILIFRREEGEKRVDIEFIPSPDPISAELDRNGIHRTMVNLVTNAIEACPNEGGRVTVKSALLPGGDRFRIEVHDNGCGIPETHLRRLGRIFFSTKGARGTGLGLWVSYAVVSEHKGQIEVNSKVGKGTVFTVTLPVRPPDPATGLREGPVFGSSEETLEGVTNPRFQKGRKWKMRDTRNILIVDDEAESREFLAEVLKEEGYGYQVTSDGKEALAWMRENRPDLVLLDIMMPRKSGLYVFHEMKRNPGTQSIPIVFVTGASQVTGVNLKTGEGREKTSYSDDFSRKFGTILYEGLSEIKPDGLIEKPVDPGELIRTIDQLIA